MKRRVRPALLQENRYSTLFPAPVERSIDIATLSGGLNLWELDYKIDINQSPDLLNVYWKDGSLSSRPGQEYVDYTPEDGEDYDEPTGNFYACYENPWQSYLIAHRGTKIYKIDPETGKQTSILAGELTEGAGGTFFVFGDKLYYMNGHEYVVITANPVEAKFVDPYVPVVIVNRKPDGTGGDTFQDENRLSPKKRIRFTTESSATVYKIPSGYTPMDPEAVTAELSSPSVLSYKEVQAYTNRAAFPETGYDGIYYLDQSASKYYLWGGEDYSETAAPVNTFNVNRTTGELSNFSPALPSAQTQSPSNLEVTISKADADTQNSILRCTCATVYGGDTQLAVVCGGTPGHPNAYFWSGSNEVGLDPTYFPFDYYNYAGASAEEYITGFGKQQAMLVIFKERSIGKSYFRTELIGDMEYLKLPYTPINENLGCNLEGSIRLVQNNLVFANTYGGVYALLDTSSYGENAVRRISRNVNGNGVDAKGLLYDMRQVSAAAVTSFDDQQRYWITANGHAYIWDYTISSYMRSEDRVSWFLFDNIRPADWFKTIDENYYIRSDGKLVKFSKAFSDFGEVIQRRYAFATMNFGTYEVLKDVLKVVFAVRSDTDSAMTITYKTDYEVRQDKTPIRAYSWRLAPRDITHRSLRPFSYAGTAIRVPRCFHVRHFSMTLTNNTINTDMSVISARVIYRFNREDR